MRTASDRRALRMLLGVLLFLMLLAAAGCSPIEPVKTAAPGMFDKTRVARGAQLAAIGNCQACHTAEDGKPYAGGLPLTTPFGTLYSTNITPDPGTGIGAWPEAAFRRAMRDGVSRDGHLLYPAFPYVYFTRMSDDDLGALYAFMMTREPVAQAARANDLKFPFGFRPLLAGWNLLFLDSQRFRPRADQSAQWNRGAYLAEGLGHCGACHSPRNKLGAEEKRRYLDGGEAEGWYVPALNTRSPSPLPWSVDQLAAYLRTGIAEDHAIAGGPMQGVVSGLSHVDADDVRAIAVYVKSYQGTPSPEQQARANASAQRAKAGALAEVQPSSASAAGDQAMLQLGASVYAGACAHCHDAGRAAGSGGALRLPLAIAVYEPDPRSLIRIIREGITPELGASGRWMPAFSGALTDQQITALASYLRHQAADAPPWPNVAAAVQQTGTP